MARRFGSFTFEELNSTARRTDDAAILRELLEEVGHRKKNPRLPELEKFLRHRLNGAKPEPDLFSGGSTSSDNPRNTGSEGSGNRRKSVSQGSRPKPKRRRGRRKSNYPLTDEQEDAVEAFMTGDSLRVTAFAGAGKTSTLVEMANVRDGKGLYLAFNRAIADEAAGEFPSSIDCRTTHSLALKAIRPSHRFSKAKLFNPIRPMQLASVLELKKRSVADAATFTGVQQAYLYLGTIRKFCMSADPSIAREHMPHVGILLGMEQEKRRAIESWVVREADSVWKRMCDQSDDIPLGHDGYLKLWSLSDPILEHEFIMLDEAQDTNPAVMHVLKQQINQTIYVGDRHQQIYEWRGAVNAMASIDTDREAYLTQSFRFGPAIAEAASAILRSLGENKPVRGTPGIASEILPVSIARTVLARTNAMVISEVLDSLSRGQKPHIVGGTEEMLRLVGDVFSLMEGQPGSHPDFFGFANWNQVVAFANTDEGEDLLPFVNLVEKYGPRALWAALKKAEESEENADIIISTAHKAKGRQWDSVRIADDFGGVHTKTGAVPEEESRLFYVAITRAQRTLVVEPSILHGFINRQFPEKKQQDRAVRVEKPKVQTSPSRPKTSPKLKVVENPEPAVQPLPTKARRRGFFSRLFGQ